MHALIALLLLASPALDAAKKALEAGKLDDLLFALTPADAVPPDEAKPASAVLLDGARLAQARGDKDLALSLAQMALKRDDKSAPALKMLGEWSLQATELHFAVDYGKRWVAVEPDNEEAQRFLKRAQELDENWSPPDREKPKRARSWKQAAKELRAPAQEAEQKPPRQAKPLAGDGQELPKVIVYGAVWCKPCNDLKAWLKQRDVDFGYVDIERNSNGARRLNQLRIKQRVNNSAIPVVEIAGVLYVGFNKRALEAALERAQ